MAVPVTAAGTSFEAGTPAGDATAAPITLT